MTEHWHVKARPARMEGRFEFPDYERTRAFLERAADVSREESLYPDMSFGRTYVNMTLHAPDEADAPSDDQRRFARRIADLLNRPAA